MSIYYKESFFLVTNRFTPLLFFLFSVHYFSQNTVIFGIENLHVTKGATLIYKQNKPEKGISIKFDSVTSKKTIKKNNPNQITKNIIITKKKYKKSNRNSNDCQVKISQKANNKEQDYLREKNDENKNIVFTNIDTPKTVVCSNDYGKKYSKEKKILVLRFYFLVYKTKIPFNKLENNKLVEHFFFTRPPPYLL